MKTLSTLLFVVVLTATLGCGDTPPPPSQLVLPAGDAELGEAAFLRMRCYDCHQIPGVDLPPAEEPNQVVVTLGGENSKVHTYSELVTSIVNPTHRLAEGYTKQLVATEGESNMTNYNQVMTVDDLINLLAYLEKQYGIAPAQRP